EALHAAVELRQLAIGHARPPGFLGEVEHFERLGIGLGARAIVALTATLEKDAVRIVRQRIGARLGAERNQKSEREQAIRPQCAESIASSAAPTRSMPPRKVSVSQPRPIRKQSGCSKNRPGTTAVS